MASDLLIPETKGSMRKLTSYYSNVSLFCNDAKDKLYGLTLAFQNQDDDEDQQRIALSSSPENIRPEGPVVSDVMFCNCCQTNFADREEQLMHYRCDWHRYNLHLRLKGLKCVTEDEFDMVSGDVSSISGSDEDSEVENAELNLESSKSEKDPSMDEKPSHNDRRYNKIFFKNEQGELLSLHKCLFYHKKNPITSSSDFIAAASQLADQQRWAVLMMSSGHFAGAIFNGKEVVDHKTFHRYTVRAKRGSAQSSRDGHGNAPKSAGASLRRYNEAALNQEIQDLMTSWQNNLDSCSLVFVRIPVANRSIFYGGKNPCLRKDDFRIRIIPFPTRRPTFSEAKRVQQMLSCIECYGQEADVKDIIPLSPQRYYCKETDQLEVRHSTQIPKVVKKVKEKNPTRCDPVDTSDQIEVEEEFEEDELYPEGPGDPLQEFEVNVGKKRRKRKPKSERSKATINAHPKNDGDEAELMMRNSLFTACKTGNVQDLRKVLADLQSYLNTTSQLENVTVDNVPDDSERCVCDHVPQESILKKGSQTLDESSSRAADSNSKPKAERRVADFLNHTMGDSDSTLLHFASQGNHHEIVSVLLQEGADPAVKNKNGKVPYLLGNNEVKNTCRRFMALFPDRYDYTQAQIPSPLTPEMEAAKKEKNAERKAVKKKSMQERYKVKKAEEFKQKEEEKIKDRFLKLTDREKRALAAERRLLQQHNEAGSAQPVLSQCFQCGLDITGKVPFEYSDYKFCTTKCLRDHRSKPKS